MGRGTETSQGRWDELIAHFERFVRSRLLDGENVVASLPAAFESVRPTSRRFGPGYFGVIVTNQRVLLVGWDGLEFTRPKRFARHQPSPPPYALSELRAFPIDSVAAKYKDFDDEGLAPGIVLYLSEQERPVALRCAPTPPKRLGAARQACTAIVSALGKPERRPLRSHGRSASSVTLRDS